MVLMHSHTMDILLLKNEIMIDLFSGISNEICMLYELHKFYGKAGGEACGAHIMAF